MKGGNNKRIKSKKRLETSIIKKNNNEQTYSKIK